MRLPRWLGLADRAARLDPADLRGSGAADDEGRWARPDAPAMADLPHEQAPEGDPEADAVTAAGPATAPLPAPSAPLESGRRLEQHFVYNALNTIAALIRTDPGRARELLFGFADLSRAADQPGDARSPLGRELEAVRGYLALEQARFGDRLRVEIEVPPSLHALVVAPMALITAVRDAVQRDIEPLPEGGVLSVTAVPAGDVCELHVRGGDGATVPVAAAPLDATV
ncbi:MAG: histidine kinase [Pseudonocardia sp.]|nr:histidine kinase [Pseudonocardia sp.]